MNGWLDTHFIPSKFYYRIWLHRFTLFRSEKLSWISLQNWTGWKDLRKKSWRGCTKTSVDENWTKYWNVLCSMFLLGFEIHFAHLNLYKKKLHILRSRNQISRPFTWWKIGAVIIWSERVDQFLVVCQTMKVLFVLAQVFLTIHGMNSRPRTKRMVPPESYTGIPRRDQLSVQYLMKNPDRDSRPTIPSTTPVLTFDQLMVTMKIKYIIHWI